jgi:hypothetical protein
VPPDSSSLDHPGQRARTIDADHREMVRFSSVHDKAYNMVREDIVELVASAEKRERKQQGETSIRMWQNIYARNC